MKWLRVARYFHCILERTVGSWIKRSGWHVLLCYISSRLLTILTLGGGDELKCNWIRRAIIGQTLKLCVALPTEYEGLCKQWYEEELVPG